MAIKKWYRYLAADTSATIVPNSKRTRSSESSHCVTSARMSSSRRPALKMHEKSHEDDVGNVELCIGTQYTPSQFSGKFTIPCVYVGIQTTAAIQKIRALVTGSKTLNHGALVKPHLVIKVALRGR